jgi:hypothetical protein|tara:strand:+ start:691 stop:960 length:270 start_codon:yes stop_codon:yes gene_type:complete
VGFRDTKEQSIGQCAMCGTKEGEARPVGRVIVELRPSIYKGEENFLCQTCFLLNNSEEARRESHLNDKKQLRWYQKLLKIGFSSKKNRE